MSPGELILVSVDDHVVEPPDLFDRHLAAQWRDRAPKMVKNRRGDEMWTFEGQVVPNVGLNAVAGRPPEEYGWEDLALAALRAYNDWHIHDWAGAYPGRFIPLALLPLWDAERSADEVRRVAKLGCHAVGFSANPTTHQLPSIHSPTWKPLWQACCDVGAVLCMHIGTGGGMPLTSPEMPVDASIVATPISIVNTASDWVFSRILRDYAASPRTMCTW
jgi:predicted TIM-barrel fold metal-dependent hydrolase